MVEYPEPGLPVHPNDIIALPKHWMHESHLTQQPFVLVPFQFKDRLDPNGPQEWAEFRPLNPLKVDNYKKTVRVLRSMRPWAMEEAAEYLERWLGEAETVQPPGIPPVPPLFGLVEHITREQQQQQQPSAWTNFVQTARTSLLVRPKPKPRPRPEPRPDAKAKAKAAAAAAAAKAAGRRRPRAQAEADSDSSRSSCPVVVPCCTSALLRTCTSALHSACMFARASHSPSSSEA